MEECINSMKLIFPSYGAGFLQACLLVRKNLLKLVINRECKKSEVTNKTIKIVSNI